MSDAIERRANGKARLAWTIKRAIGVSVPVNECGRAAEAALAALHLSPDAAAGLADGSWVAVPREPVAWLHRLTMETGDAVTKYEEEGLDPQDVWGIPGEDYSPEYRAEVFPLFASQQNGEK